MINESILTCPYCDYEKSEALFENVSPVNFRCESCKQVVKITSGECCIYCQYGDYPCVHTQIVGAACCSND